MLVLFRVEYLHESYIGIFARQYVGKADFLVFRAMDQHGFLGQLQEKKLVSYQQQVNDLLLIKV